MSIPQVLAAIQHTTLARAITKSNHLVIAALQIVHIFGFLLLLGSLLLMSLRRLGWAFRQWSVAQIAREPLRLFMLGEMLAVFSGTLMFLTGPTHYFYNVAFELKMLLLSLALVTQALLFRGLTGRSSTFPLERWYTPLVLLLWFGVAIAGRAIGFV